MSQADWLILTRGQYSCLQLPLLAGSIFFLMAAAGLPAMHSLQQELSSQSEENDALQERLAVVPMQSVQADGVPPVKGESTRGESTSTSVSQTSQQLAKLAAGHDLTVSEAQYARQKDSEGGPDYYEVNLPLQGDYASLRAFLSEAKGIPGLALVDLSFTRALVADAQLGAQLQFRLYSPG